MGKERHITGKIIEDDNGSISNKEQKRRSLKYLLRNQSRGW